MPRCASSSTIAETFPEILRRAGLRSANGSSATSTAGRAVGRASTSGESVLRVPRGPESPRDSCRILTSLVHPCPERPPKPGGPMQTPLRHRPSPAMVVACLALLVALTGTSVAAVQGAGAELGRHCVAQGERRHEREAQEQCGDGGQRSATARSARPISPPVRSRRATGPAGAVDLPGPQAPPERSARSRCGKGSVAVARRRRRTAPTTRRPWLQLQRQREGDLGGHGLERRRCRP